MRTWLLVFGLIFFGCGGNAFQTSDPCGATDCPATSAAGSGGTPQSSGAAGTQAGAQAGGPCLTCAAGTAGVAGHSFGGGGGDSRPDAAPAEAGSDARVADAGPAMVDVGTGGSMPTPSLYIIVDRTWYSVDQPVPYGGAISAGSIFAAGLKQFAEEQSGAPIALLYEPIRVSTPDGVRNSRDPAAYATPAVPFTTDASTIAKSLDNLPVTVGTLVVSTDLVAATSGALQYIQAEKPARCGVIFLINITDSSLGSSVDMLTAAQLPYFFVSEHGQNDLALFALKPTWVSSPDEVAAALHAVVGKLSQ
jgi:hypothetical protein